MFLWSAAAVAAAKPSIAVLVDGPRADAVRADIISALPSGTAIVDPDTLQGALAKRHVAASKTLLRAGPHSQAFVTGVHNVSADIGADAIILVRVRAKKGKPSGEFFVVAVAASQDAAAIDDTVTIGQDGDHADEWKKALGPLLDVIRSGTSAEAAEPGKKTTEEKASPKDEESGKTPAEPAPEPAAEPKGGPAAPVSLTNAMIEGFLGLDLGGRQFHYNQRVTPTLRPYDLPTGVLLPETPGVAASVDVFPLARSELAIVRDLGISARVGDNLAKAQLGPATTSVEWYSWEANLRYRILLGPRESASVIGLEAGTGELAFKYVNSTELDASELPGVDYHYLRFGVDGRIPLGPVAILAGIAYRPILSSGSLGVHFPRETIGGMDADLGLAFRLARFLEARVVVNYTRVWAAFNPQPGDMFVAGGGLDQFMNADIGVAAFF
ncbi:MAG: hypothetical protein ABSC94_06130 [Polyangiaceae bacterium]|jgi:hypothetical protein